MRESAHPGVRDLGVERVHVGVICEEVATGRIEQLGVLDDVHGLARCEHGRVDGREAGTRGGMSSWKIMWNVSSIHLTSMDLVSRMN